jgi:DoxX-like protein
MHIIYIVITLLAAAANTYAAWLNFVGAESVKGVADRLHLSHTWMIPLGILLASGAAGLSIGFAVPALGKAAAVGLILYFTCAVGAHIRARDPQIGGAVTFLVLGVAALIANVAYHSHG